MELRHLRYFVAVAEEAHITRAAERLGMQQPPLSQQIKALERELDVQLFHRRPRGVELTEPGRVFFREAQSILAQLERALEATRRAARGEQGRITVGMTPTAPFHPVVSSAVRAFREAFPLVSVTLDESLSDGLLERLRDERMDVAFIRNVVRDPAGLVVRRLLGEVMVVALPTGHVWQSAMTPYRFVVSHPKPSFCTAPQVRGCTMRPLLPVTRQGSRRAWASLPLASHRRSALSRQGSAFLSSQSPCGQWQWRA